MRRSLLLLASCAVGSLAAIGCRDRDPASDADSALTRDLTLANAVKTVPALRDLPERPDTSTPVRRSPPRVTPRRTPAAARRRPTVTHPPTAAPAPVAAAPAPVVDSAPAAAPTPAPARAVIAAGTSVGLTSTARVCSDGGRPGDKMVAETSEPLTGTNGLVFPAGSAVVVEIASIVESPSADSSRITFRLKSITANGVTYPVTGDVIPEGSLDKKRVDSKDGDKKRVIGGAVAGAILGGILGGGAKGAVVGAAAGGATGAVVSAARVRYQSCLPAGAAMRLTLTEPVEVTL